jgi:hypothetical protein
MERSLFGLVDINPKAFESHYQGLVVLAVKAQPHVIPNLLVRDLCLFFEKSPDETKILRLRLRMTNVST